MRASLKISGYTVAFGVAMCGAAAAQQALPGADTPSSSGADAPAGTAAPAVGVGSNFTATGPAFQGGIAVAKGSGRLIRLPHPVANIFAADPAVVEVRPASPTTMFVFGKGLGATTIVATDASGNAIAQYSVSVGPSNFLGQRVGAQAETTAPGAGVTAESEPGGMVVRGTVQSAEEANNVINQAKIISSTGTVINNLQVVEPVQVMLKVRIASMSRTVTRELGIDWTSVGTSAISIGKFSLSGLTTGSAPGSITGATPGSATLGFPGGTFEGVIDALAADNLAHVLAEPTLTTLSGTQASFQVGGQFPIPESSGTDSVSVTYKSYGVLLTFTPTVFSDGRIALQVSPQLSSISTANSAVLTTNGSSEATAVPSINIATASSTVILGSGQGMAMAGLLQDTTNQTDNGVPGLSEVPLLGALFRGDSYQRIQQELVITVTPYLVTPVSQAASIASPDDGWTPPNDLQRILFLRDNGNDTAAATIPGDAGFMVQ